MVRSIIASALLLQLSSGSKKSIGLPNSIPHQVSLLPDISKVLADLFNISLETGIFLELLKIVKVILVFKYKGAPTESSNYRPMLAYLLTCLNAQA